MFGNPCQKPVLLVYISLLVSPVVHSSYRLLVIAIISFLDTFFQSRARSNKYVFCFVSCLLYCVSCILYCVFCILHFAFCIYSDHIQSWHLSSQSRALLRQPYPQPTPYLTLYCVFCILHLVFCILYLSRSYPILTPLDWGNPIHNRPRISPSHTWRVVLSAEGSN